MKRIEYKGVNLAFSNILAKVIARNIKRQDVVFLKGELGVGKTTVVQSLIHSLLPNTVVNSPTFNLVFLYNYKDINIWHFDLYRLKHIDEVFDIGIEDAVNNNISIIEWPQLIEGIIEFTLEINIFYHDHDKSLRNIIIQCNNHWYDTLVSNLQE